MYLPHSAAELRGQLLEVDSFFPLWILGIEFRMSRLQNKCFIHRATSLVWEEDCRDGFVIMWIY